MPNSLHNKGSILSTQLYGIKMWGSSETSLTEYERYNRDRRQRYREEDEFFKAMDRFFLGALALLFVVIVVLSY